jgi:hypothetical protein
MAAWGKAAVAGRRRFADAERPAQVQNRDESQCMF